MVKSSEYRTHPVFNDLCAYIEFYDFLSEHTFAFLTAGTRAVFSMDSYAFSSIQGTLTSIRSLLRAGRMNDAFALVRKYYDSAIINAYTGLYLAEHFSVDEFIVEHVEAWRSGQEKLPSFKQMRAYLAGAESLRSLNRVLVSDERYERLRRRCNDHLHYNYYAHMLLNIRELHLEWRIEVLDQIRWDVRDILVLHLAYVFSINFRYMGSSDYVDALECGLEPEYGSQYWVANAVQSVFDSFITPWRPEVTEVIKANSVMELK